MKILNLFLILAILTACGNSHNDAVELSYEYKKDEKKLEVSFYNDTQEDFIVLVPKVLSFKGDSFSKSDKALDSKKPEAILSNGEKTTISHEMEQVRSLLSSDSLMIDRKYFPTAILLKKNEKKVLDYNFNNDFISGRTYKSDFFKMRDVLNIPQNLDIIKKMTEYRQNDHYKIYIDDFNIKDSLKVKF